MRGAEYENNVPRAAEANDVMVWVTTIGWLPTPAGKVHTITLAAYETRGQATLPTVTEPEVSKLEPEMVMGVLPSVVLDDGDTAVMVGTAYENANVFVDDWDAIT